MSLIVIPTVGKQQEELGFRPQPPAVASGFTRYWKLSCSEISQAEKDAWNKIGPRKGLNFQSSEANPSVSNQHYTGLYWPVAPMRFNQEGCLESNYPGFPVDVRWQNLNYTWQIGSTAAQEWAPNHLFAAYSIGSNSLDNARTRQYHRGQRYRFGIDFMINGWEASEDSPERVTIMKFKPLQDDGDFINIDSCPTISLRRGSFTPDGQRHLTVVLMGDSDLITPTLGDLEVYNNYYSTMLIRDGHVYRVTGEVVWDINSAGELYIWIEEDYNGAPEQVVNEPAITTTIWTDQTDPEGKSRLNRNAYFGAYITGSGTGRDPVQLFHDNIYYDTKVVEEPQYRGKGTFAAGTGSVSPGAPVSAADDIWLLVIESDNLTAAAPAPPSGGEWTLVTWQGFFAPSTGNQKVGIYWHRYDGVTTPNLTVPASDDHVSAIVTAYKGCPTSGDPVHRFWAYSEGAANQYSNLICGDTALDSCLVVLGAACADNQSIDIICDQLDSLTDISEDGHDQGTGGALALAQGPLSAAGTIGPALFTMSGNPLTTSFGIALLPKALAQDPTPYVVQGENNDGTYTNRTTGGNLSLPTPYEHWVPGDVVICSVVCHGYDGNADAGPSDFPFISALDPADASVASGQTGPPEVRHTLFYWRVTDDSALLYDRNTGIPNSDPLLMGTWILVRGCKESGSPFEVVQGSTNTTPTTSGTAGGGTTSQNNCLGMIIAAAGDNVAFDNWSNSDIPGLAEIHEWSTTSGADLGMSLAVGAIADAGSVGTTSFDMSLAADQAHWFLALLGKV